MKLAELTKESLEASIGLLPIGSVEQHGPHLPMGTDSIVAESVAQEVDKLERDTLLFPTVYYGCSIEHGNLPHVSVNDLNFMSFVYDLLDSTKRLGIKGVILINGHGGNSELLQVVSRKVNFTLMRPKVKVVNLLSLEEFKRFDDLHAGTVETSLMKFLRPELVKEDKIPVTTDYSEHTFSLLTSEKGGTDGIVTKGTIEVNVEIGKRVFEEMISLVRKEISTLRSVINE
ncbi:MAG: creatininase family protein [Metallosphaera sp.]